MAWSCLLYTSYELQQAFQKLMRGKTVIMIAHRLSSIQNVDQILFVQNGKIVEQGTHNELMAYNGRYKDFQDVYCKACLLYTSVRISLALNPMGSIQQIEPIRRSTAVYARCV